MSKAEPVEIDLENVKVIFPGGETKKISKTFTSIRFIKP